MPDSAYFDSAYFDGSYFDVDAVTPPSDGGGPGKRGKRGIGVVRQPQREQREDDAALILVI